MRKQQDAGRGKVPPIHFFRELLLESNIICGVDGVSVQELFDMMLDRMKRTSPELDIDKARNALMEREELIPTIIAPGLAVPHARIDGIKKPYLALACSPSGIDFHSELGLGNVVVLFLSPAEEPTLHLQILASLASAFKQSDFAGSLSSMRRPEDVIEAFGDGALPTLIKA
ncbi:MAG: PTS sugar transporter subunit IIA, partial [Victivallaceae bacterium]|nr:PTS sugar transporter subunit IIA [Victivallaceae bacterium]